MIDANGQPQSVLVVGGGSDIAAAVLERLVKIRCERVVLAGPNFSSMEPVRERVLSCSPAKVDLIYFDLGDLDTIEKFTDSIFSESGPFDLVILAGGILGDQLKDETNPKSVRNMMTINLTGPAMVLTAVGNKMSEQGFGSIVVISSVAGERVRRSNYIYGATKAGLDGFSLAMGEALEAQGIKLLVVRPGFVKTKMTSSLSPAPLSTTAELVAKDIVDAL